MGNKGAKPNSTGKPSIVPDKPLKLTCKDITFISKTTGLSKDQIEHDFHFFMANNPDGKLNVTEFNKLYTTFRNEPVANLDEIDDFVFRAFDSDNNGFLTFNEFMIALALTTRGDPKVKLEYAFELYDADNNGYLTTDELKVGIAAMFDLLGAQKTVSNPTQVAAECAKEIDKSKDGRISKDEFVTGCLENYSIKSVLSPFN